MSDSIVCVCNFSYQNLLAIYHKHTQNEIMHQVDLDRKYLLVEKSHKLECCRNRLQCESAEANMYGKVPKKHMVCNRRHSGLAL